MPAHKQDPLVRIWSKIDVRTEDECWPWLAGLRGSIREDGVDCRRPAFYYEGRNEAASRVLWALLHGPILGELKVCHTCDNGFCMNPGHFFLGTNSENMQDMIAKKRSKTYTVIECPRGHEYTDANTHVYKGMRFCRTCDRERHARRKADAA